MKTLLKKYYFFIITIIMGTGITNCIQYRSKASDKNINFELYNKSTALVVCTLKQISPEKSIEHDIVIPAGVKLGIILENPQKQFKIYLWYKKESLEILRYVDHKFVNNIRGLTKEEKEVVLNPDYLATIDSNPQRKKIYLAFENNQLRPRKAQLGGLLNTSESGLSLTGNVKSNEIRGVTGAKISYK